MRKFSCLSRYPQPPIYPAIISQLDNVPNLEELSLASNALGKDVEKVSGHIYTRGYTPW